MTQQDQPNGKRRKLLKGIGATGALLTTNTVGVGSAARSGNTGQPESDCENLREWLDERKPWDEQSGEERDETIRRIKLCAAPRGRGHEYEIREEYGIPTVHESLSYDAPLGDQESDTDGGAGTEDITNPDRGGILLDFEGYHKSGDVYAVTLNIWYELNANCRYSGLGTPIQSWPSGGADPVDGAAILWFNNARSEQYFERADPGNSGFEGIGDYCEFEEWKRDQGATFRFEDWPFSADWLDAPLWDCKSKSGTAYVGTIAADIRTYGDWDPSEREIYAQYTHTYNKEFYTGSFNVGLPPSLGVTVRPTSKLEQERIIDDESTGRELKLTQAQLD